MLKSIFQESLDLYTFLFSLTHKWYINASFNLNCQLLVFLFLFVSYIYLKLGSQTECLQREDSLLCIFYIKTRLK